MNNRFDKNFRPQNPTFLTNNGVNQSKTSMQIHLVDKCNVYTLQSLPFCSIVIFNNKTTSVLQFNFAFLFLSFKFLVCLKALVFLLIQEPKESRNSQNVILHICRSSCLLVSFCSRIGLVHLLPGAHPNILSFASRLQTMS